MLRLKTVPSKELRERLGIDDTNIDTTAKKVAKHIT